jgi:beta-galactosidase
MNYGKSGIPKQKGFYYGADYNPDQWEHCPDILERDIELMKKAGVTSASIGIFAWTSLEPEEGRLEFGWLDRIMDRFAKEGMQVFLATPSGSKPMWMSEAYPEIRRVNKEGIRQHSGGRHNHCLTSPLYREKVARINTALAERYGKHPALALWHVGNEFSGDCHCNKCQAAFQVWLRERYQTLEALNDAWWTKFWNHSFTDWNQIQTHDRSVDGLQLDWLRFVNDQHFSFIKAEIETLRAITPEIPCTTNFMGTNEDTNYWQWAEGLDVISNDLYPQPDDRPNTWKQSIASDFIHSLMRGMSGGKSWMLLECSPSSVNWGKVNKLKRPEVHRQEVLQAVANGADTIHYFQWRKGRGGFEKFHGAVIDHEGSDQSRVFKDCAQIGSELSSLASLIESKCPPASVAILYDWESRWALNASAGPKTNNTGFPFPADTYTEACQAHYRALTRAGQSVDLVTTKSDFSNYKVLVIPALYLIADDLAQRLRNFTEQGGILIGTYLTGYVDLSNRCYLGGFPGPDLRSLFGIWNEELDNLYDEDSIQVLPTEGNVLELTSEGTAQHLLERIHAEEATPLATFASDFHAGLPAVTRNEVQGGQAYYLAAQFDDAFLGTFYTQLFAKLGLVNPLGWLLPEGVVVRERKTKNATFLFLFNYKRDAQSLNLRAASIRDLLNGEILEGTIELPPYASFVCEFIN